jgi:Uncharacterized protein conserved in bacteria (DUF2330)
MRRWAAVAAMAAAVVVGTAGPALACGGLVGPNGTVQLLRTSTLAAYSGGIEHYVTSFEFSGGGAEVGSIVPLPGVPTSVEKGGAWTLQRLERETHIEPLTTTILAEAAADGGAEVLQEVRIDALELTVLRGGGSEVAEWATSNGFGLTPDAPEILDFYAERSPVFLAARFDADAARERGQGVGDGTPVHLTIPTDDPWVPLRILGLGLAPDEQVEADVYLLTPDRPNLLGGIGDELSIRHDAAASDLLLDDLRVDEGMSWVPRSAWLTYLDVNAPAGDLDFDLAVDAFGDGEPSATDAGLTVGLPGAARDATTHALLPIGLSPWGTAGLVLCGTGAAAVAWFGTSSMRRRAAGR